MGEDSPRAAPATPLAEPLLAGRYRYVRELGRGATGRVILARDVRTEDAPRALKVVPPAEAGRLSWEHELLTGIAHPNLAPVHELLTVVDGAPPPFRFGPDVSVLVEGFAPGARASRAIDGVALEARVGWVLDVGVAVGRALAAIHRVGLVHGDVKPDNVVVGDDPLRAILVDLGLARPPGAASTAAGTPAFLAPEAWQGQRSTAVDLFALGATLHHLLGGKSALTDTRSASVAELWARATTSPRGIASLPDSVPASLGRLIESLLSLEPAERPATAREAVSRLSSIRAETGGEALSAEALAELAAAPTESERAMAVSALPLAGRRAELDLLTRALQAPGVVVVSGPAGAGRTRLVHEAVRRLQRARAEAKRPVPTFAVEVAGLGDAPAHDAVMLIEDADAIDLAEGRALLAAAELDGHSLVLVLERSEPLDDADHVVGLGAARSGAIGSILASALAAKPSAALVDAALEASGGLPGRLCRLLAAALLDGRDPTRPETLRAASAQAGAAPTVLPAHGQNVAEHLAVAGGSVAGDVLTEILGGDAAAGLSALAAEGAVSFGPTGEPRLRRDLVIALSRGFDEERKREVAASLRGLVRSAEARAFVHAALGDDDASFESLDRALAERRGRGDAEGAIGLARLAEAIFETAPPTLGLSLADALRARGRYDEALEALASEGGASAVALRAEILRLLGRREEATELVAEALSATDDGTRFAARATAARLMLDRGEIAASLASATSAAAEAVATGHAVGEARVSEVAALSALYAGEPGEATELAERAIAAARRGRAPEIEARGHAVAASVALSRGEVRRAAERYGRAFELAEAAGERHAAAAFLLNLGVTRLDAGDLGPATDALRQGARRLARLGRDQDLSRALYNLGLAGVLAGDDDLATIAVKSARAAADRANDRSASAFAAVLEAELALRDGKLARARAAAIEAAERAADATARDRAVVASRRALIHAALGEIDEATRAEGEAREAAAEDGSDLARTEHAVAVARVALSAGGPEDAVAAAAEARASAERFGTYEARLRATLSSADAADASGDHDAARRHLSSARALLDTAANTLPPAARARMRGVGAYQRAFAAVPRADGSIPDSDRWRRLVFYARRLTAERRVGRLYEEVLDAAIDLSGAERGFIVLRDDDGSLRVRVARGLDRRAIAQSEQLFSRSLSARAIDSGSPISTVDALRDERLDAAASVHALALRSVVAVPFKHEGDVRGAIYLDDRLRPGAFGPDDVRLLSDLADLASIALDGAERLRRERRQARRLEVRGRRLEHQVETQARQIESLRRSAGTSAADGLGIVGRGAAMQKTLALVERVAPANVPVLVTGESGTGKELVARALHKLSRRADAPFVIENVSAIPETLLESELFGHVRGAFTGADKNRVGLFEAASGGTLFLDEIGEMSPAMQAKLLRAVQEGEIRPVGSERARNVDVRLVAATHRDLPALVAKGSFREDLYYRLAVVTIELPPLRERPEDIPPLVAHFLERHGDSDVAIDDRALSRLCAFAWPGNVRQLENEIQRALVMSQGDLRVEHLSTQVRGDPGAEAVDELDLKGQLRVLERRLIKDALSRSGGNQTRAAKLLGVSRYGLQKMLKRLEIK